MNGNEADRHNKKTKLVLVGWDGADWQHITPMLDQGLLPGLESLIDRGVMGNLATLQPVLSPMLWNSIATGKTADKHGIHGFVEPIPGGLGVRPSTSISRKTKAIWNILNQNGWRSNVVSWWASYPAEPINGNIVTNLFNAIKRDQKNEPIVGPHVIHPQSRALELADYKVAVEEITENDIGPFCPNYMQVDQDNDSRLATLAKLISDCASIQSVTTTLLAEDDWDFTAVYFDSIDHFCHAFMPYHPPQMPNVSDKDFEIYKDVIQGAYRLGDMMLQRIIDLAGKDTIIMLCSDHGFQSGAGRPLVTPMEPAGPALWHRNHGIFVMAGPGVRKDQRIYGANIIDMTPTLLHAVGLPVGEDMDGRVLTEAFEADRAPQYIASWDEIEGDSGLHPEDFDPMQSGDTSSGKQDDLIKQFVALGYIEDPGDSAQQAAENAAIELRYNLARALFTTNRYPEALPIFEELVNARPWEDRFWKNLAYCCYELKLYDEAQQIINRLYAGEERIPPFSKLILALCAWEHGNRDKAYSLIDDLLSHRHRVTNVYATLGQLLVSKIRDLKKAEEAFDLCTKLDPDYAVGWEGLAGVYYRTGRYAQCIDAALQAVGLLYRLPKAHFYLGLALEKTGETDHAIVAFERVMSFNLRKYKMLAIKRLIHLYRLKQDMAKADQLWAQQKLLRSGNPGKPVPATVSIDLNEMPSADERRRTVEARRKKRNTQPGMSGKTFLLVSGLPRSGTSLMMQMLRAGGIEPQTDGLREADENNPLGYLEWEAIKKVKQEPQIFDDPEIESRAVKVISMLLPSLPPTHQYKVIFMTRPIHQVAASQSKMIDRLEAQGPDADPTLMEARLTQHRDAVIQLMENHARFEFMTMEYESLLNETGNQIQRIMEFVGEERLDAASMPSVVNRTLHRER